MNIIQTVLPRSTNESYTIVIALKRHLQYRNAYQKGRVRPHVINNSLNELCKTTLYKMQNVKLNKNWNEHLYNLEEHITVTNSSSSDSDKDNCKNYPKEMEIDTLIHGFIESRTIHSIQDKVIEIAPAKGKQPLGIFQDKYAKEMNFPTHSFGEPRDERIEKKISYQKIAQWELQNSKRTFSYHTTNLFFKTIKILIFQVFSTLWIRI
jgi:hypothetical protein